MWDWLQLWYSAGRQPHNFVIITLSLVGIVKVLRIINTRALNAGKTSSQASGGLVFLDPTMRRISGFNLKVFRANVKQQSCVLRVPLAGGIKAGAAESIPGAVRVSGEAAVGAGRAVGVAAVQ